MSIKRIISILLCAAFIILVSGCEVSDEANKAPVVSDPVAQTPVDDTTSADTSTEPDNAGDVAIPKDKDAIDVDLTLLSSTMVYSEVYNMMYNPDDYIGKSVKMSGTYRSFLDENTDTLYHYCVITDATACCAQGMEFVLENDLQYPKESETICVVGTFETYMEGENKYCTLKNARIM